jgi:hypothetical protein
MKASTRWRRPGLLGLVHHPLDLGLGHREAADQAVHADLDQRGRRVVEHHRDVAQMLAAAVALAVRVNHHVREALGLHRPDRLAALAVVRTEDAGVGVEDADELVVGGVEVDVSGGVDVVAGDRAGHCGLRCGLLRADKRNSTLPKGVVSIPSDLHL